jgi:hypothetical protein
MIFKPAMTHDSAPACMLGLAYVFAALGLRYRQPNALNRFPSSKREVLLAT